MRTYPPGSTPGRGRREPAVPNRFSQRLDGAYVDSSAAARCWRWSWDGEGGPLLVHPWTGARDSVTLLLDSEPPGWGDEAGGSRPQSVDEATAGGVVGPVESPSVRDPRRVEQLVSTLREDVVATARPHMRST